jgi:hypothetical protein
MGAWVLGSSMPTLGENNLMHFSDSPYCVALLTHTNTHTLLEIYVTWKCKISECFFSTSHYINPHISVCLSVRPSIDPAIHPSIHLPVCPSVPPSTHHSIYLSVRPSIHPLTHPPLHIPTQTPTYLSMYVCIYAPRPTVVYCASPFFGYPLNSPALRI